MSPKIAAMEAVIMVRFRSFLLLTGRSLTFSLIKLISVPALSEAGCGFCGSSRFCFSSFLFS